MAVAAIPPASLLMPPASRTLRGTAALPPCGRRPVGLGNGLRVHTTRPALRPSPSPSSAPTPAPHTRNFHGHWPGALHRHWGPAAREQRGTAAKAARHPQRPLVRGRGVWNKAKREGGREGGGCRARLTQNTRCGYHRRREQHMLRLPLGCHFIKQELCFRTGASDLTNLRRPEAPNAGGAGVYVRGALHLHKWSRVRTRGLTPMAGDPPSRALATVLMMMIYRVGIDQILTASIKR